MSDTKKPGKSKSELERENERLKRIAKTLQFYARRYCDGRMTYAVSECNDITRTLLEMGVDLETDSIAGTIWAKDGMPGCVELDKESFEAGHPLATGHAIGFPPHTHLRREIEAVLGTDLHYSVLKAVRLKALADTVREFCGDEEAFVESSPTGLKMLNALGDWREVEVR